MLVSYLGRLALVAAHGAFSSPAGLLDEVALPMRVWPWDIDAYGHLNNGRFLTMMDFGRWSYSLRTPLFRESLKRKWRPLIAAATIQFRRELALFRRFNLTTRLAFWDERSFYFEHRLEDGDVLFAKAYVRGVTKAGKNRVAPGEMLAALGHPGSAPTPPEELVQWTMSEQRKVANSA